ncbi:MAG: minor capsid protein [Spirochaetes bacterium]|nr:minor capsid protein [Spirochaetota bacterium]
MYPINLEHQYEKYFVGRFDEFNRRLLAKIMPHLDAYIDKMFSSSPVKQDAPEEDIFHFLEQLRQEYGDWIPAAAMESAITRNFSLIDSWSRDKIVQHVETMVTRLNTPQPPTVTGRPTPAGQSGEKWLTTIDLLNRENGLAATQLDRIVRRNLNLVKSLQGEQFDDVYNVISDGLTRGDGLKTITDNIREASKVNRSRAKFWARDQASKFFGEVTKTRQTGAGIPGYIWRTVGDIRVRDSHAAVAGHYSEWSRPPEAGVRGDKVHPGEDFNCRCWAEPAFGPEYAENEQSPSDQLSYTRESGKVFTPSASRKEAEAFIQKIGVTDDPVNYSGLNIDTINRINKSFFDLKQKYPYIKPILISETRSRTSAGRASFRRILLNKKNYFGQPQNAVAENESFKRTVLERFMAATVHYDTMLKTGNSTLIEHAKLDLDIASRMMNFNRFGALVPNMEYESVIYHEYGHVFSDQVYGMLNGSKIHPIASKELISDFINDWHDLYLKLLDTDDIFKISMYAIQSESECFAECFVMHNLEAAKLPGYIRDFMARYVDNFKSVRK